MSKKKNKEEDQLYKLEKENKELKNINRALLKRLRKVDKGYEKRNYREEETIDDNLCKECGKGYVYEVPLGPKKFFRCSVCSWQSKLIKV